MNETYACAKMVIEQLQDTFESSIQCVSKTTGKHNLVFLVKNKNESFHVYSTSKWIKVNISFKSLYNSFVYSQKNLIKYIVLEFQILQIISFLHLESSISLKIGY